MDAEEEAIAVAGEEASRGSTVSSMDAEEEAIAVRCINKVRAEIRGEAPTVRARKQLIESIETD